MKKNNIDINEKLIKLFESDDGYLFEPKNKTNLLISSDDRLIKSFNKITEFVEKNDRLPDIDSNDISEASLANRLESIKYNKKKAEILKPEDKLGLLELPKPPQTLDELFESDRYGIFSNQTKEILNIRNTPKIKLSKPISVERRKPAKNFDDFKKGFLDQQKGLKEGRLKLVRYFSVNQLQVGDYYLHDNQLLRIIDIGEKKRVYDRNKERFRIVFENGTESNMYRRSLSARLYENGYWVVEKNYIDETQKLQKQDIIKGYIYILKTKSEDTKISIIKDLYKIGFSTTPIEKRIKNAEKDPTFLMSPVEKVSSYIVTNDFNPQKIEYFLHRIFTDAALDMKIIGPDGREYRPLEWYSVPLSVIDQAINLLQSGEITNYIYNNNTQKLEITGN